MNSWKTANKCLRNEPADRATSTSSCASSYHQHTADSGMSAGVGCYTELSGSLKSHASAGSENKTISLSRQRSALPPFIDESSLLRNSPHLNPHENLLLKSCNPVESFYQNVSSNANPPLHPSASQASAQSTIGSSRLPLSMQHPYRSLSGQLFLFILV